MNLYTSQPTIDYKPCEICGKICFNSDLVWTTKYAGICKDCYDKLKEQKNNGRYKDKI